MNKKILLTAFIFTALLFHAQVNPLPPRPPAQTNLAPFYHGVASGDPLSDRVIIWTRVTPTSDSAVSVNWDMATDTLFANIVNTGTVVTDSSVDFTVKIDVTGLNANAWYYYRFKAYNKYSIIGRTRTLPVGNVDSLRFASFSCSDYQTGYFNAYQDIAKRNDLDAIIHLGDFYYEYKAGGSDYQGDTSMLHPLSHDALTTSDYRLWNSQYRLEPFLRNMLQEYPIIIIWDDHDVCDNSWYSGGNNHNPATQGSWFVRKHGAHKAFFEWTPIRPATSGNDSLIHRNFKWGNLINMIMLDTRFEARDSSLGSFISTTNAYMADTNRQMLGHTQLNWLKNQLIDTTAQWRVIGNQVMIAPLTLNLLFTTQILNGDQWDGYPAERKRVYDYIAHNQNKINDVVFITGDIHSSWANDLPHPDSTYVSSTGRGSIATEFVGTSITSSANVPATQAAIMAADPWFKYVNFSMRGYLLFDVNKTRFQGDFIHVSDISGTTYTSTDDAQWVNLDGLRHLTVAPGPLGPRMGNPPLVSNPAVGINKYENSFVMLTCYPNPTTNGVTVQYYLKEEEKLNLTISDMNGKIVYSKTTEMKTGVNNSEINLSFLPEGTYLLNFNCNAGYYSKKIIKLAGK